VRAQLGVSIEANVQPSRASEASPSPPMSPKIPLVLVNSGPTAAAVSDPRRRARELEPLSADRFGVHFTADAELRDLIERARALASHRLPNGDLAGLMKLMAACFVRHEEKRRFGIGARPRRVKTETEPVLSAGPDAPPGGVGKHARYVPVTVRRAIHLRDTGQCSFVSGDGRRCSARAFLELDHRNPFARQGAPDARNIRLLCRAHNLLHARKCFGMQHVAAKIAASKRCRSTTIEDG